jgi:hypothetical protein
MTPPFHANKKSQPQAEAKPLLSELIFTLDDSDKMAGNSSPQNSFLQQQTHFPYGYAGSMFF